MDIETDGGFWLVLGLMALLFPLRFLAGLVLAAAIHEGGHLLALRLTGSRVRRIELRSGGARIVTDPMEPGKEMLCALAGLGQTVFNLLPVYPLDGGRMMRNICCKNRRFGVQ